MDTSDQSDSDARAWSSKASSPHPDFAHDPTAAPGHRRGILGKLARHWWRILLLWIVVSAPLAWLIFEWVEPTFQAVSMLRIEPAQPVISGSDGGRGDRKSQTYLQTQVEIIKSDSVLDVPITNPTVINLPRIKNSADPRTELKNDLAVDIVGRGTYLIRVALESKIPSEAAAIVHAVVDAYMERHSAYHRSSNSGLKKNLEDELQKLDQEIAQKTAGLKKLVEMDGLDVAGVRPGTEEGEKNVDPAVQPAVHVVTAEQLARLIDRLIQVDLDLIDGRARLEAARLARDQGQAKLRELEGAAEEAKRRKIGYTQYLERLKVERKNQDLTTKLVEQDLAGLKRLQGTITEKLKQLDFEIGQDNFQVRLLDRAQEPRIPANRVRLTLMAVAAIGVFFLILGGFCLSEIRAGRAAGPALSEPPA